MTAKKSAFTLVEILIVVIILGILAAIVIPQFTEASNDARQSALASDLQTVRSQIELFKVQHNDMVPGCKRTSGTVGSWDAAVMVTQLTTKTDVDGNAGGTYGPYLQKFPSNPFASTKANEVIGGSSNPADGKTGWYYDAAGTGKFAPADAKNKDL